MAFRLERLARVAGSWDSPGIDAPSTRTGRIGRLDPIAKRTSCVITSCSSPNRGIPASRSSHLFPINTMTAPHFVKVSSMTWRKFAPGFIESTSKNT